jgi:hypothetical protein
MRWAPEDFPITRLAWVARGDAPAADAAPTLLLPKVSNDTQATPATHCHDRDRRIERFALMNSPLRQLLVSRTVRHYQRTINRGPSKYPNAQASSGDGGTGIRPGAARGSPRAGSRRSSGDLRFRPAGLLRAVGFVGRGL